MNNKLHFLIIYFNIFLLGFLNAQNIGIGKDVFDPDSSALLEIRGNKGLLIPRMTTAQRDSIHNPAQSLLLFNTTNKCFETYIDNMWLDIWCSCGNYTVTYDGVTYNTIKVGDQCWLLQNLRTKKYNDNTYITPVSDKVTWQSANYGAYSCYNNDTANCLIYGALYNWHAVNSGKLCPKGWHVPSDTEWKTLEVYLGMTQAQADATGWRGTDQGAKIAGNANLWDDGYLKQNNNFGYIGFNAIPGGYRDKTGDFSSINKFSCFWTNNDFGISAWYRKIEHNNTNIFRNSYDKMAGFSVRCIRD